MPELRDYVLEGPDAASPDNFRGRAIGVMLNWRMWASSGILIFTLIGTAYYLGGGWRVTVAFIAGVFAHSFIDGVVWSNE